MSVRCSTDTDIKTVAKLCHWLSTGCFQVSFTKNSTCVAIKSGQILYLYMKWCSSHAWHACEEHDSPIHIRSNLLIWRQNEKQQVTQHSSAAQSLHSVAKKPGPGWRKQLVHLQNLLSSYRHGPSSCCSFYRLVFTHVFLTNDCVTLMWDSIVHSIISIVCSSEPLSPHSPVFTTLPCPCLCPLLSWIIDFSFVKSGY